jgi:DNA-binding response OmpR family regulator
MSVTHAARKQAGTIPDANGRNPRYQLDDAIRAWKRAEHRPGAVAVVDPDDTADSVARCLAPVGIHVDRYADLHAASTNFAHGVPQAVVLSVHALAHDSAATVARLRRDHRLNVLLALGMGDVERATAAIVAGATPVLDLPLRPAQILQHLQRVWVDPPQGPQTIAFGGLELDEVRTGARLFGRSLNLTGAEFELLWRLAEHDGRAVRRQELWALWPWADDQDGTLVAAVVRLRRKLAYHGFTGTIRTVRGVGYGLDLTGGRDIGPRPRQRGPVAAGV